MNLAQLQRRMAADIMRPLARDERIASSVRADYIKPNDRLTSRERLEIYSRSYWYRLIDSLYEDFPGLRAVLGNRAFLRLITAYLAECPSRSFSMRNLGSRLEHWVHRNPDYAGAKFAIALDMLRLEWAHIEAWDGPSEKALDAASLAKLDGEFRLALQPYVGLLHLHYPVDEFRLRLNSAGQSRKPAVRPRWRQPKSRFLAVHRWNLSVFYKTLSREEFRILRAIGDGKTIAEAIELGFAGSALGPERLAELLEDWFKTWAESGWFAAKRGADRQAAKRTRQSSLGPQPARADRASRAACSS